MSVLPDDLPCAYFQPQHYTFRTSPWHGSRKSEHPTHFWGMVHDNAHKAQCAAYSASHAS